MNASSPTVALLGTGRMGLPMASRLCQAGLRMHVWNRNRARAEPLAAEGAQVQDRKSTRLNSSHSQQSRMPSSA